ncbi:DUF4166 domain-containing protein [Kutzneria albida]|uniref:DUF4166 domain-containing protein n=1 Tax=Kutzneria albida DSM 43870 TaxID=1449976 RepID=W5W8B4_9PSEU|nr:DUF4166 domain-containing protein [Kutzneria albida]AHH97132.1 hypothetical protein KALB_3768 [Kutzneria albida DSM 43870]
MTSIFERAMGTAEFGRLHPMVRERFSVGLSSGTASIATGVMSQVWCGAAFTKPFLHLGKTRHILFPETGTDVPFTMENWPYLDRAGREVVTFTRTFELPGVRRRFDATMVVEQHTNRLIDYLGTHQHVGVQLHLRAGADGALVIRSGEQRFRMGRLDFRVPAMLTGTAAVREWFDEDTERFGIEVRVVNRRFGPLFGYQGGFTARYLDTGVIPTPASVKPTKEETRT